MKDVHLFFLTVLPINTDSSSRQNCPTPGTYSRRSLLLEPGFKGDENWWEQFSSVGNEKWWCWELGNREEGEIASFWIRYFTWRGCTWKDFLENFVKERYIYPEDSFLLNNLSGLWLLILWATVTWNHVSVSWSLIKKKKRINGEKAKLRSGHVARGRKIFVDVERTWWNNWQNLWRWIPNNQKLLVSNSDLLIGWIRFFLVLQGNNSYF